MANTIATSSPLQAVPALLRSMRRWIRWQFDGDDKRPCDWSTGRWTGYDDQEQWRTASEADLPGVLTGISFATPIKNAKGEQLLALDLDACRDKDTGAIEPWAEMVLTNCGNSYTEITPSGQGLRVLVVVRHPPEGGIRHSHFTPKLLSRAPGTQKKVECQTFGCGSTGFVTITGKKLEQSNADVVVIDNLDWWPEVFTREANSGTSKADLTELPTGFGPPPTMTEIGMRVRSTDLGRVLMDCQWKGSPLVNGTKSNSEAFAALERIVIQAALWHGEQAVRFLLHECPRWSDAGLRDVYSREDWVVADLLRVAPSKPAFSPIPPGVAEPAAVGTTSPGQAAAVTEMPWARQTLGQLLAEKPAPWFVQHYVRCKQVGVLGAASTVGKSTLAAAWMMSALHGEPWCGKKVRGGSVLALVGENRRGFANNLEAYARHHGFSAPAADRKLELVDFKLPLSSPAGQQAVQRLIATVAAEWGHAPVLVVIDTLSSHWAESEDSSEFMAPAMRALTQIAQHWNCVILVIHHLVKAKDKALMPSMSDLRGSGVLGNNTDFAFGMCAPEEDTAHLGAIKLKNDKEPPVVKLHRVSVDCGVDEEGDPVSAGVFEREALPLTKAEELATRALEADVQAVAATLVKMGHSSSKEAVVAASGMRLARGRQCFTIALDRGWIVNTGTERKANYIPGKTPESQVFLPVSPALD